MSIVIIDNKVCSLRTTLEEHVKNKWREARITFPPGHSLIRAPQDQSRISSGVQLDMVIPAGKQRSLDKDSSW